MPKLTPNIRNKQIEKKKLQTGKITTKNIISNYTQQQTEIKIKKSKKKKTIKLTDSESNLNKLKSFKPQKPKSCSIFPLQFSRVTNTIQNFPRNQTEN